MTLTNCNSEAVCAASTKTDNIHEILKNIAENVNVSIDAIGRICADIDMTLAEDPRKNEFCDMKGCLNNLNDMTRFAAKKLNEIAETIGC